MVEPGAMFLVRNGIYRGGFEVRNHAHAGSTGSFTTLFDGHQDEGGSAVLELSAPSGDRLVPRQPMCHQPPPLHATVPESRSPSPGEVCEASSRQSRNGKDRVDAGAAVRILHAYPSSSDTPPRTSGSARSSSGEEWSRRSARPGDGT